MLEKEFVPYEESLALKELGFDEKCLAYYKENELYQEAGVCYINADFEETMVWDEMLPNRNCAAPLYQQAFRWFRDKNYDVSFRKMDYGDDSVFTGYYYTIYKGMETIDLHGADKRCKTYEEIELACLKRLIEIVKEK